MNPVTTFFEKAPAPVLVLLAIVSIQFSAALAIDLFDDLGPAGALIVALAFPIGWGMYELVRFQVKNYIAVLGLVSVLLTGGIGLLEPPGRIAGGTIRLEGGRIDDLPPEAMRLSGIHERTITPGPS